jgi:hypothetical protein
VAGKTAREQSIAEGEKGKKGKGKKRNAAEMEEPVGKAVRARAFWALPDTLILNAFSVPSRFCSKTGWKSDGWRRYAAWNGTAKTIGEVRRIWRSAGQRPFQPGALGVGAISRFLSLP